jgi:hypothetical protein
MVASSISLQPTPSPTSALSIAGRAGHAFTPQAMLQGFVCQTRGVELVASGPSRVHARVRSKRVHDVHLRAEHGKLLVACSCPARSFGIDVCKHAWAALLEVDRQDALADLRKSRGPLIVEPSPPPPAAPVARDGAHEKVETKPSAARPKAIVKAAAKAATEKTAKPKDERPKEGRPEPKKSARKQAKPDERPERASAKLRARSSKR